MSHINNFIFEELLLIFSSSATLGPSSRSGHRMVVSKKNLVVFGGYHDNGVDYKYFSDVHMFNLETRTWKKIEPAGKSNL